MVCTKLNLPDNMAKLDRLDPAMMGALAGIVDFYFWKGIPVARMFPRPPVHPRSVPQVRTWSAFSASMDIYNTLAPFWKTALKWASADSAWTGRDLFLHFCIPYILRFSRPPPLISPEYISFFGRSVLIRFSNPSDLPVFFFRVSPHMRPAHIGFQPQSVRIRGYKIKEKSSFYIRTFNLSPFMVMPGRSLSLLSFSFFDTSFYFFGPDPTGKTPFHVFLGVFTPWQFAFFNQFKFKK